MQVGRITTAAVILGLAVTCTAGASASAATCADRPSTKGIIVWTNRAGGF